MHLQDRINSGMLFYEHGHKDPIDIRQEKQLQEERDHCKEMMFEYNNTHPREDDRRQAIISSSNPRCICPTVTMCTSVRISTPISIWCWWMMARSPLGIRS